jgi:hypothetical protein
MREHGEFDPTPTIADSPEQAPADRPPAALTGADEPLPAFEG